MHYSGDKNEISWQGTTEINDRGVVLLVEDEAGVFKHIMIPLGRIVPDNWVGKRVKITVEKLPKLFKNPS